ncbi:hypothetical protein PAMC26510_05685 [Caballeronia sordidicola]|uniref:LysR family transcriptional regulator n=1 Tax=Caballeronia sordidicola TaxID=196367 RepID=A0A242N7N9_CABSO|nr:hypothetical protein PAMC26510_05685 [Caballeronia sordidicola]
MQVQDLDLKLLRIFETIVQCGGFAAAQPVLNIGASRALLQNSTMQVGIRPRS